MDYKFWASCLGGCLSVWVVAYNLKKYIDIEAVKSLSDLRSKLNEDEKKRIHRFLITDAEEKTPILQSDSKETSAIDEQDKSRIVTPQHDSLLDDNVELFDYLGTIELGAIMLKKGIIDYDEFYNQFGYRVENIMRCEKVKKHICDNCRYYRMLIYMMKRMKSDDYRFDC